MSINEDFMKEMEELFAERRKQVEYQQRSYKQAARNNDRRSKAWDKEGCKDIYNQLIAYSGGLEVVRKGMRGKAKQLAITAFMKGEQVDLNQFKASVDKANQIHSSRGK